MKQENYKLFLKDFLEENRKLISDKISKLQISKHEDKLDDDKDPIIYVEGKHVIGRFYYNNFDSSISFYGIKDKRINMIRTIVKFPDIQSVLLPSVLNEKEGLSFVSKLLKESSKTAV